MENQNIVKEAFRVAYDSIRRNMEPEIQEGLSELTTEEQAFFGIAGNMAVFSKLEALEERLEALENPVEEKNYLPLFVFTVAATAATVLTVKSVKKIKKSISKTFEEFKEKVNESIAEMDTPTEASEAEVNTITNEVIEDTRENYQKITIIDHIEKNEYVSILHEAIISYDSDKEPRIADISIACGYHPAGYGLIGKSSIEKLEDGTYKAIWKTSNTCD